MFCYNHVITGGGGILSFSNPQPILWPSVWEGRVVVLLFVFCLFLWFARILPEFRQSFARTSVVYRIGAPLKRG